MIGQRTIAVTGVNAGENPQPGVGVVRSLRRMLPDATFVGLAYELWESGLYAADGVDVGFHLPRPSEGQDVLLARLDEILATQPIDILIPTLDSELNHFIALEDDLRQRGIRMFLPTADSLQRCRKDALPTLAKATGVSMPRGRAVGDAADAIRTAAEIGYPVMVKGPYCGADRCDSEAAVIAKYHEITTMWGGPITIQECLAGGEFGTMIVGDGTGEIAAWCMIRKTVVTSQGKGFGAVSIHDDGLLEISRRLTRQLKWRGPAEFEFKQNADGEHCLIEVNPRFPAWCDFPSSFGHNLPAGLVELIDTGLFPMLPDYEPGAFFLRHSQEVTGRVQDMGRFQVEGMRQNETGRWLTLDAGS